MKRTRKGSTKTSSLLRNKDNITDFEGTLKISKDLNATYRHINPGKLNKLSPISLIKTYPNDRLVRENKYDSFNLFFLHSEMINIAVKEGLSGLNKFLYYLIYFKATTQCVTEIVDEYTKVVKTVFNKDIKWKLYFNSDNSILGPALGGQQTEVTTATIEYIINGFDADKEKTVKEILQKDKKATEPQSQKEFIDFVLAHKQEFGIGVGGYFVGDINNNLNLIIRDNGIGVNPSNFESTFLSIGTGNKYDEKYLEGKHNFGSTSIWGHITYKAICSRMDMALEGSDGRYGLTLLKRNYVNGLFQEVLYMTIDDEIPYFTSDEPVDFYYGSLGETFESGSLIKLFGLSIPGATEKSTKRFANTLNCNLVDPLYATEILALKELKNGIPHRRIITGRTNLIDSACTDINKVVSRDLVELELPKEAFSSNPKDFENIDSNFKVLMDVTILNSDYVFQYVTEDGTKKSDGDYLYGSLDSRTIVYSDYGQRHAFDYISAVVSGVSLLGYPRIKNNVMITVFMDDLPEGLKSSIFTTNREMMKNIRFTECLRKAIYSYISSNSRFKKAVDRNTYTCSGDVMAIIKKLESDARFTELKKKMSYVFCGDDGDTLEVNSDKEVGYTNISDKRCEVGILHLKSGNVKQLNKHNLFVSPIDNTYFKEHRSEYDISIQVGKMSCTANEYRKMDKNKAEKARKKTTCVNYDVNNSNNFNFPGLSAIHRFSEKVPMVDGEECGKKKFCLEFILTPDNQIVKYNDTYLVNVRIRHNNKMVYSGTLVLFTANHTGTKPYVPKNKPKNNTKVPMSVEDKLTPMILVSNSKEYNNVLSYNKVLSDYGVTIDDFTLLAYDRSGAVLSNIFLNLDNQSFKKYLVNSNKSFEDCKDHCHYLAFLDYISLLYDYKLDKKRQNLPFEVRQSFDDEKDEYNFMYSLKQSSRSIANVIEL